MAAPPNFITKEAWMQQHGFDPNGPPPKAGEGENAERHAWFAASNAWQDYAASAGVTQDESGQRPVHEHGQADVTGWQNDWNNVINNADDPMHAQAVAYQNSKDFKGFNSTYGNEWFGFNNWQRVQNNQQRNNPHSSSNWLPSEGGGYFDTVGSGPGAHTVTYDQYGRPTGQGTAGAKSHDPFASYEAPTASFSPNAAPPAAGGKPVPESAYDDPYKKYKAPYAAASEGPDYESPGPVYPGGVPYTPPQGQVPAPGAPPAAAAQGDGGGQGFTIDDYSGPDSPMYHFGAAPTFAPPQFRAPTGATMSNDPGYQFRQQQGETALERSKAAQGLLRGGGTLKDIIGYGQQFASQEYENVYNRALQAYDRQFGAAQAAYAPQFQAWQTLTAAEQARAMAQFNWGTQNYTNQGNWALQSWQAALAALGQAA